MTNMEILDEVQRIRADNNKVWMELLKLALLAAPVATKSLLGKITDNDQKVSALLRQIANQ